MRRDRRASRGDRRAGSPPAADANAPPGTLFVIATPIGHLDDLSPRAVDTLRLCRLIACEDTRVTRALLHRHAISSPVMSCHRHNENARTARILAALADGIDVALVSDGGTPGLSDPGAAVVRAARAAGVRIAPIPGPSAVTTLWSVSGFPPGPFTVIGFLPHRKGERRRMLESLRAETRPLVFFESPHRILQSLGDMRDILGDRQACLGREMTKIHEEYPGGPLSALIEHVTAGTVRGEFTLLVAAGSSAAGAPRGAAGPDDGTGIGEASTAHTPEDGVTQVLRLVAEGVERREALRQVARSTGIPKRDLYAQLVLRRSGQAGHVSEEEE